MQEALFKIIRIAIFIFLLLPIFILAQDENREYAIKAAMLEKFSLFVEWPEEIFYSDTSKFVISVFGKNPFDNVLEKLYKNHLIKNKKVDINYISDIADIKDSNILFIANTDKKILQKILVFTKNKPILTISDTKDYAEWGVLINLYQATNTIRFEINEKAVKESGLLMSYQLFNLAKIVESAGGEN